MEFEIPECLKGLTDDQRHRAWNIRDIWAMDWPIYASLMMATGESWEDVEEVRKNYFSGLLKKAAEEAVLEYPRNIVDTMLADE